MSEHPSHPDQLMAQTLGVCWHSPGLEPLWACTPLADWERELICKRCGSSGCTPERCPMTASSPTDRRDADDATFAAERARLDRLPVADIAGGVAEAAIYDELVSLAPFGMIELRQVAASVARRVAALERTPGTDERGICQALTGCVNALDRHNRRCPAAPGTDSRGQAVQRVLALHRPWYEVGGARHDNMVTVPCSEFAGCGGNERVDCPESDGDGHEVLACYECRYVSEWDEPGHLLWPCPTVLAVAGPQRDHDEEGA